nr:hypothetical protein CFP56_03649 [Quercus suber]
MACYTSRTLDYRPLISPTDRMGVAVRIIAHVFCYRWRGCGEGSHRVGVLPPSNVSAGDLLDISTTATTAPRATLPDARSSAVLAESAPSDTDADGEVSSRAAVPGVAPGCDSSKKGRTAAGRVVTVGSDHMREVGATTASTQPANHDHTRGQGADRDANGSRVRTAGRPMRPLSPVS